MYIVNKKPRGKPIIFADSRFTWDWISSLSFLAALTALIYLLVVQEPEAAEQMCSGTQGLISPPVLSLVGSFQNAACGKMHYSHTSKKKLSLI